MTDRPNSPDREDIIQAATGGPDLTVKEWPTDRPEGLSAEATGGLVWYSPCGYEWRDLFLVSAPIPHCPQCQSTAWATFPPTFLSALAAEIAKDWNGRPDPRALLETLADHIDGLHGECHCRRKIDEFIAELTAAISTLTSENATEREWLAYGRGFNQKAIDGSHIDG